MTVDEVISAVRLKTLIDDTQVSDAQMTTWINEGLDDVDQRMDWPFLEREETLTTVVSQQPYPLSAFSDVVIAIISINEEDRRRRVLPISKEYAATIWGDNVNESSRATYFYIFEENINLVPIPSSIKNYLVAFHTQMPEVTTGADTFLWFERYHRIMIDYVESKTWEREEDYEKAFIAAQRFELGVRRLQLAYQSRAGYVPWTMGRGLNQRRTNVPFIDDWGS